MIRALALGAAVGAVIGTYLGLLAGWWGVALFFPVVLVIGALLAIIDGRVL